MHTEFMARDSEPDVPLETLGWGGHQQPEFQSIVGASRGLCAVLDQIRMVAPTDCTVLIEGETGTGKEVVAQAIHNQSRRRNKNFVKVNCAAIPAGLLESELFGHERGAFTDAVMRRAGKFEVANGGTLFLDEIGDMPRELQSKLLRVLQEREFERVGSTQSIRADVRVLAATNQDLPTLVREKKFRMDLYYRLNVFPIALPALRERRQDVRHLVQYFARKASERMNRHITRIAASSLARLESYPWPGNIRELQNVIERAVILADGETLHVPLTALDTVCSEHTLQAPATLAEAERAHILEALKQTRGVVGGRNGAAVRLGLPRTTLLSRMQKFGIGREATAVASDTGYRSGGQQHLHAVAT